MLTEEQMTVSERRKYLKLMKARYVSANRAERGCLLTEMHQVTGLHRKSVIRLMHAASLDRKKRSRPRSRQYGLEVERVVVRIWESRDYICAERLTPGLLVMARHLARFEPLGMTAQVEAQLATISRATVARILRNYRSHLVRFWKDKVTGVQLSRSRPYQKNDNRMVEQKNDTLVRQFVGQLRLDTPEQVQALGALYERMWVYYNLFQPVLHLRQKTVVGDRVKRKWDQAQTPYERVQALGVLPPEQQARLQQLYEQTNPLALRQEIYQRLAGLWDMPSAEAGTAA